MNSYAIVFSVLFNVYKTRLSQIFQVFLELQHIQQSVYRLSVNGDGRYRHEYLSNFLMISIDVFS